MSASAVEFKPVEESDILHVAQSMRKADMAEVWASGHYTPEEAIRAGLTQRGKSATVWINSEPVAILGVVTPSLLSSTGIPWMLGSRSLTKYGRQILTGGRLIVDDMTKDHSLLVNYVHAKNKSSVRWLTWLGFELHDPVPFGKEKELFHRFEMRK